jgi:hypothetical protein
MRIIAVLEAEHLTDFLKIEVAKGKMSFEQPLGKIICSLIDLLPHRQSEIVGGRIVGGTFCVCTFCVLRVL